MRHSQLCLIRLKRERTPGPLSRSWAHRRGSGEKTAISKEGKQRERGEERRGEERRGRGQERRKDERRWDERRGEERSGEERICQARLAGIKFHLQHLSSGLLVKTMLPHGAPLCHCHLSLSLSSLLPLYPTLSPSVTLPPSLSFLLSFSHSVLCVASFLLRTAFCRLLRHKKRGR